MEGSSHCSDGGCDYEFVYSIKDHVTCVSCHLPSREPHMMKCGHVFCKSYLDRAEMTKYTVSSMCKDTDFMTYGNKPINQEVQGLHELY